MVLLHSSLIYSVVSITVASEIFSISLSVSQILKLFPLQQTNIYTVLLLIFLKENRNQVVQSLMNLYTFPVRSLTFCSFLPEI